MSQFSPIDPSPVPMELPIAQNLVKKQEETDPKKFESEMKKIKTDADQKKQRKKKEEENEGAKKIIVDAQELIEKRGDSLYTIQKPDIKSLLKKKKTEGSDTPEKVFVPVNNPSSVLFSDSEFTLNLAEPSSSIIEKEKITLTFGIEEKEGISLLTSTEELPEISFSKEPVTEVIFEAPVLEKKETVAEAPSVENENAVPAPEKPKASSLSKEEEEKPEKKLVSAPAPLQAPFFFISSSDSSSARSNLHKLSPEIFALFERMAGVITILQMKPGLSQTTINLTAPQFASSIFFGCRITIEECDSAPKEFNIRLSGSEQAVKAFTAHKQELEIAFTEGFENGKFHFKVHQVDADLSSE